MSISYPVYNSITTSFSQQKGIFAISKIPFSVFSYAIIWSQIGRNFQPLISQILINNSFIYRGTSLSGIFLIAKLTLVYPCKPLENRLSRILYTWILLDVFLTFVRPKDVIRLKIRHFILNMYCRVKHYNT